MRFAFPLILLLGLWTAGTQCVAASVGVNFAQGTDFDLSPVAPGAVTGVVPQDHWNNVFNVSVHDSHPAFLVDDAGLPTSAAWPGFGFSGVSQVPRGTPTGDLLHTGVATIVVVGAPYSAYDLYVYLGATPLGPGIQTFSWHMPGMPFMPPVLVDPTFSPVLVEATTTTPGNYVHARGLTGSFVDVSVSPTVLISGLQFVSVPEPSALVLACIAAIGVAMLGARRTR